MMLLLEAYIYLPFEVFNISDQDILFREIKGIISPQLVVQRNCPGESWSIACGGSIASPNGTLADPHVSRAQKALATSCYSLAGWRNSDLVAAGFKATLDPVSKVSDKVLQPTSGSLVDRLVLLVASLSSAVGQLWFRAVLDPVLKRRQYWAKFIPALGLILLRAAHNRGMINQWGKNSCSMCRGRTHVPLAIGLSIKRSRSYWRERGGMKMSFEFNFQKLNRYRGSAQVVYLRISR